MKKQSNLFSFFSINSQTKSNSKKLSTDVDPLKIQFKSESPQNKVEAEEHHIKDEDEFEDLSSFKTLKKRKLQYLDESEENPRNCNFIDPLKNTVSISSPSEIEPKFEKTSNLKQNNKENKNPKAKLSFNANQPQKQSIDETHIINVEKENKQIDINIDDFDDKTPFWATREQCKDKNNRSSNDPNYDPTTLYIPPLEKKKLTPTMRQFWEIKSDNFDKVLFFKLGKFYELFYEDAYIGNKFLDLNWMGRKMHVGFPEKALERYAISLVNQGFKVAVIEQVETTKQMEERLKNNRKSCKNEEKTIQRELVEIMTKGTYVSGNETHVESKYLLTVRQGLNNEIGFCAVESMNNFITIGHVFDDENYTHFKTLLCQIKPTEIVYDPENVNKVLLKLLKSGLLVPVLSPLVNKENKWHSAVSYNHLEKIHGFYDKNKWPTNLSYFYENKAIRDLVFSALSGCLSYLEQVLILDKVLIAARFSKYDPEIGLNNSLILDSQALQHLEIFETGAPIKPEEGTLFSFINKTVSPGGKRMLKRWLCAPCLNVDKINSRLDALEDLQKNSYLRDSFRKELKELPDLERLCAKIYQYSIKKCEKIVYYEDVSSLRLREFKSLLNKLLIAEKIILDLQNSKDSFKSFRLKQLVTYTLENDKQNIPNEYQDIYIEDEPINISEQDNKENIGLLPGISTLVKDLVKMIIWEGKDQNIPTPGFGLIESYDRNREIKAASEEQLKQYLMKIRKRFNDNTIDFCHVKFRYELEIPEKHVKGTKKPEDFEFTSARAGYQRFLTEEIKEMVCELEEIEEEMKKQLKNFAEDVFRYFRENYKCWDSLHAILSELDCLTTLSIVSFKSDGIMCRPEIEPLNSKNGSFIALEEARHPCLCMVGINFIPNNIFLGHCKKDIKNFNKNLMLLTGPNMGGKSTLLRMTSIAVIMAQIGCYVPAKTCRLSIVDRIFTRLGASDKLMDGKSTFFIEMEETLNIVKSGTCNSLAILDELGRGTSTFDGVALAFSVLKYLVENLKCRSIFATHYHVLIEEFKMYPEIDFFHMDAIIDEKNEKVVFLYKLKKGECHQSFGLNVAKVI